MQRNASLCVSQIVERVAKKGAVVLLDFDGTLAPIVTHPHLACMSRTTTKALRSVTQVFPVAVITGRSLADVTSLVRVPGVSFSGNHGFEFLIRGKRTYTPATLRARKAMHRMRCAMQLLERKHKGVYFEDKVHSFALHYRHARRNDHDAIRRAVFATARETGNIRIIKGILVFNILPKGTADKGTAARRIYSALAEDARAVPIFIGDDCTDEYAFRAFPRGVTIRVGRSQKSAARYYFRNQRDVNTFLTNLAKASRFSDTLDSDD